MKKMRKYLTIILVVIMMISMAAVPVHADTKVADWHTDQFRKMYAKMQENEAWDNLEPAVKKELSNYARSEKKQAEALLILRAIDLEVSVKQAAEDDNLISRIVNLLSSKEFQTYLLLSRLSEYDGIQAKKNSKGIYTIYTVDIPPLPAEE